MCTSVDTIRPEGTSIAHIQLPADGFCYDENEPESSSVTQVIINRVLTRQPGRFFGPKGLPRIRQKPSGSSHASTRAGRRLFSGSYRGEGDGYCGLYNFNVTFLRSDYYLHSFHAPRGRFGDEPPLGLDWPPHGFDRIGVTLADESTTNRVHACAPGRPPELGSGGCRHLGRVPADEVTPRGGLRGRARCAKTRLNWGRLDSSSFWDVVAAVSERRLSIR